MNKLFLIMILSRFAYGANGLEPFTYFYNGKTITVQIGKMDNFLVNDLCLEKAKSCQALKIMRDISHIAEIRSAKDNNYAGAYCELLHGSPLFLKSIGGEIMQFCVFQDLTMIDSQALYNKHFQTMKRP